jgi:aminoglycoside phosphotransferase (APT) family kinase protein
MAPGGGVPLGVGVVEESWEAVLPAMLRAAGLPDAGFAVEPLTGGVSSDIVRITLRDGRLACAKRALARLKVASEWQAPLERNHYEVAWLRRAAAIVPGAAPKVLAEDQPRGIALLEYLPADDFVLWKAELLAGRADPAVPVKVADALGRIHAATLNDHSAAREFPTDHLIDALRLDPYLRFTASRHPEVAEQILGVLETTAGTKLALVHGDVSPKNILVAKSDRHPVLLDAECAWFGDPAFDGAFCLNHLLLKAVHLPFIKVSLLRQAQDFAETWLGHFPPEMRADLERRTAALLPCLLLARVDGKSPVEYLDEANRTRVRALALPMIRQAPSTIGSVIQGVSGG